MQCVYEHHFSRVVSSWDRIPTSSSYFRPERINEQVYSVWIMEKRTCNSLAVAIAVATGIMLATSGSAELRSILTTLFEGNLDVN